MEHFFYSAYGLSIRCDFALPEMVPLAAVAEPDVIFRVVEGGARRNPPQISSRLSLESARIEWPDVGCFEIENGREVRIEPAPGVADAMLRAFLSGMILSVTLYQRGFLVLHASCVALRGADGEWGAVGFLGFSGAGKSTMAAALHARGHRLVSDDVIAVPILAPGQTPHDSKAVSYLPIDDDQAAPRPFPLVYPAFPQLRLWPQSLQALGEDAAALPLLYPKEERRARRVERGFEASGAVLRALFVLKNGPDLAAPRLINAPALMQLVRHTYCVGLGDPAESAAQFQKCGILAQTVPVFALERPKDLSRLGEVAAFVETALLDAFPDPAATIAAPNLSKTAV